MNYVRISTTGWPLVLIIDLIFINFYRGYTVIMRGISLKRNNKVLYGIYFS